MPSRSASQPVIPFASWTTSQREFWSLQVLEADGAALNTGRCTELVGELNVDAFIRASRQTVEECEALRIRIGEQGGQPFQWIAPIGEWSPAVLDFSHEADPSEAARNWMGAELARAFEIPEGMFSWTLIKVTEARHFWCLITHHLAVDGFAHHLVACRMADHYSRLVGDGEATTEVPGPLSDLLQEDAAYRQSEEFKSDRAFWLEQMADLPAPVRLTSRTSNGSYMPVRYSDMPPASVPNAIRKIMADTGVSLSGLFVCLAAMYLRRLTGASDISVGLLVAARTSRAARNAPGVVSNTVPIRLKFNAGTTLADLIVQVRARIREALAHQRFPLSELKGALPGLKTELYAISVNVRKFDFAPKFGGLATTRHSLSNGPVDDTSILVFEQPNDGSFQISLDGNINRYDVAQLSEHYKFLMVCLEQVCRADPTTLVDAIDWISEADCASLLDSGLGVGGAADAQRPMAVEEGDSADTPKSDLELQICQAFARVFGREAYPAQANFFHEGGYSLLAARLITALAKELDVKIPLRALFDNPTPRALARYLDQRAKGTAAAHKPNLPLLVLCPSTGLMREMIDLRNRLQTDFSVLWVEYPNWRREWNILCDIELYLDFIVAQVRAAAPEPRPITIVGYSFGAYVAYAMSIALAGLGYTIERLHIIDGRSPVMPAPASAGQQEKSRFGRFLKFVSSDAVERQRALGRLVGLHAKKPLIRAILKRLHPMMSDEGKNEFLLHMTALIDASIPMQGIRNWTKAIPSRFRLISAPCVLFRSIESEDNLPYDLGWAEVAPNLEIIPMRGDHQTIVNGHNVPAISSHILPASGKSAAAGSTPRLDVLAPAAGAAV